MWLCKRDLSKECDGEYKDCTDCVLDKIRAEFISLYPKNYVRELELGGCSCVFSLNKILQIIDKYKAEREEE